MAETRAPSLVDDESTLDFNAIDKARKLPVTRRSSSIQSMFMKFAFLRIKKLVSKKKRRHTEGGYDLDLTYITPQIIAMGYPSVRIESIYRNHLSDVYGFLTESHGEAFKLYNLCIERKYAKHKFHGRVSEYGFQDHCPPPLPLFQSFCQDAHQFFTEHPDNVIAIHCKAGKGRTGVMICAYFLYSGRWLTPEGAMGYYATVRSLNHQGVTIPSQRRFIEYFSKILDRGDKVDQARIAREQAMTREDYQNMWEEDAIGSADSASMPYVCYQPKLPAKVPLVITSITFRNMYRGREADMLIRSKCNGNEINTLIKRKDIQRVRSGAFEDFEIELDGSTTIVQDEVLISFKTPKSQRKQKGHFWLHTSFIENYKLVLKKIEIDHAVKDIKRGHKRFPEHMEIELKFRPVVEGDYHPRHRMSSINSNDSLRSLSSSGFSSDDNK